MPATCSRSAIGSRQFFVCFFQCSAQEGEKHKLECRASLDLRQEVFAGPANGAEGAHNLLQVFVAPAGAIVEPVLPEGFPGIELNVHRAAVTAPPFGQVFHVIQPLGDAGGRDLCATLEKPLAVVHEVGLAGEGDRFSGAAAGFGGGAGSGRGIDTAAEQALFDLVAWDEGDIDATTAAADSFDD